MYESDNGEFLVIIPLLLEAALGERMAVVHSH